MDNICETCRFYEQFSGVCVNADSEHCADMPWQYGATGCEHWEELKKKDGTQQIFQELIEMQNS